MQPDKPASEVKAAQNLQQTSADQAEPATESEAINVVCDELFTSHMLGAAPATTSNTA